MNLFQWLTLPVLSLLLIVDLVGFVRHPGSHMARLVRCLLWAGAAITIAKPDLTQFLADEVGLHRGADLVFYLTTLSLIAISLAFYARYLSLQRQITDLVRYLAILEARRNSGERPK